MVGLLALMRLQCLTSQITLEQMKETSVTASPRLDLASRNRVAQCTNPMVCRFSLIILSRTALIAILVVCVSFRFRHVRF